MTAAPICYLSGTIIRTVDGDRKIDDLQIGDLVKTLNGTARPVKWVGRLSYSKSHRDWQKKILPVLITKGALGDGLPFRNLYVSQAHMLCVDGSLIEARFLVNGTTIRISDQSLNTSLNYYHVELADHDVIYAEGQPAETLRANYRHREKFENFIEYMRLYPNEGRSMPKLWGPVKTPSVFTRLVQAFGLEGKVVNHSKPLIGEKVD